MFSKHRVRLRNVELFYDCHFVLNNVFAWLDWRGIYAFINNPYNFIWGLRLLRYQSLSQILGLRCKHTIRNFLICIIAKSCDVMILFTLIAFLDVLCLQKVRHLNIADRIDWPVLNLF